MLNHLSLRKITQQEMLEALDRFSKLDKQEQLKALAVLYNSDAYKVLLCYVEENAKRLIQQAQTIQPTGFDSLIERSSLIDQQTSLLYFHSKLENYMDDIKLSIDEDTQTNHPE